jgi:hypothetical protein
VLLSHAAYFHGLSQSFPAGRHFSNLCRNIPAASILQAFDPGLDGALVIPEWSIRPEPQLAAAMVVVQQKPI